MYVLGKDRVLTFVRCYAWKLVYVFTCVFRVGDAEPEVEIKALEKFVSEVMALDHPEIVNWFITHSKFYPETRITKHNETAAIDGC